MESGSPVYEDGKEKAVWYNGWRGMAFSNQKGERKKIAGFSVLGAAHLKQCLTVLRVKLFY